MQTLADSPYFLYIVMPLLIFLARIADVTLGTMRIVFVARGNRLIAPLLGFFEVFIWIVAIGQIMEHANNIICYLAYSLGFALGNYVGLLLESRLAIGMQVVRIITSLHGEEIARQLNQQNFGATQVNAQGATGNVQLIYCVVQRKELRSVVEIIRHIDPQVFYSVEDIRTVSSGIFPGATSHRRHTLRHWRRGK